MDEATVRKLIREELQIIMKNDKYVFSLPTQILDGRNIQTGRLTGTTIATAADQKLSVYGVNPVIQAGAISSVGGGGADSDGVARGAIDSILTALRNFGIIAT